MKRGYILVKDEEQKQQALDGIIRLQASGQLTDIIISVLIDTPETREYIERSNVEIGTLTLEDKLFENPDIHALQAQAHEYLLQTRYHDYVEPQISNKPFYDRFLNRRHRKKRR